MTDTSNPEAEGEQMRAVVTHYGTQPGTSHEIPEDLQPYAKQVLAMDPLKDVPGNVKGSGDRSPFAAKVDGLPPEMRTAVYDKLSRLPKMTPQDRAKAEDRFVREAIQSKLGSIRSMTGVGPGALPFHKEQADIAMQVRDLYRQRDEYQTAIDRVRDVRKAEDPVTGEVVAEPIYSLSALKRSNYRNNIADIDRRIRLLVTEDGGFGTEGRKRMQKALLASSSLLRQRDAEQSEAAEAKKLAAENARKDRVAKLAESYGRMGHNGK
jgi:hypothetical protein